MYFLTLFHVNVMYTSLSPLSIMEGEGILLHFSPPNPFLLNKMCLKLNFVLPCIYSLNIKYFRSPARKGGGEKEAI